MPLLTIEDLLLQTPGGRILGEPLHTKLFPGQLLLVQGPNGSGKTTLLRALLGNIKPKRGKIYWSPEVRRTSYLAQVPESDFHIPITLADVLAISTDSTLDLPTISSFGLLDENHLGLAWNRASGGERKRALLTRIFINDPSVLILDEPFNHLDESSRWAIGRSLNFYLSAKPSRAAIVVSHEPVPELDAARVNLQTIQLRPSR